ncbi:MAG: lysophospholipase, partial [Kiritimatiellia bacterium]
YMMGFIGFDPARMPDDQDFTIDDLPQIPEAIMNRQRKATAANLIRRFGCRSFKETFIRLNEFTVRERLADIHCPCLGLVGAGEGGEPRRQYDIFLAEAGGPATGKVFTAEEGADSHCQVGNLVYANAVVY